MSDEIHGDGIYTEDGTVYTDIEKYLRERECGYETYVGVLSHRSHWESKDLSVEFAMQRALHRRKIGVILVYTMGRAEQAGQSFTMQDAVERYFVKDGKLLVDVFVNFLSFGKSETEGTSLFEKAASFYRSLNVPVLHPIWSNQCTNAEWERKQAPLQKDLATCFDVPEMQGMIEPIFLGAKKGNPDHWVLEERVEKLADRIEGWIHLRKKKNSQKRLAIYLNSAVCSGVEATLGRAVGLNSFESAVQLLQHLSKQGYDVGEKIPQSAEALRQMFLEKKAYSDFRWTSVEDIVSSGGAIYHMPKEEYLRFYQNLPQQVKEKVEKTWGQAPGEAMVLDQKLVIAGIRMGNILLMIQPKRGCFGAKCTGEVCKILQDPSCPPTHQYMATYFYASDLFGADAWIHMGTHGSLEFLPGKAAGLGSSCFSDILVGRKPNLYVVNSGSVSSALQAKRRSYAVTIDHVQQKEGLHTLREDEIQEILRALDGGFLLPGEGARCETEDVLTGRNIYGVHIDAIPSKRAYANGTLAADQMLQTYLRKEGTYPQQMVVNMISMDIPRTQGEQLSLALSLLGVRPIWKENGKVAGMELIPLEELKRPRMDVSVHISGILRDTWPQIIERLDAVIQTVAAADEEPEQNYLIKNMLESEAKSAQRIFGNAPGTYSGSMGLALKASAWKDERDLARYFIDSSSYVYGKSCYGEKNVEAFLDSVKRARVTCDMADARYKNRMGSSYSAKIQGGYALAAESIGVKQTIHGFMGESSKAQVQVKTMKDHVNDMLTETLFQEEWKQRRMEEGYDGAAEIMHRIQSVFEMQCVNECFSSETLDALTRQYLTDETMRSFLQKHNVYAGEEASRRMLELHSRGKWKPSRDVLNQLRRAYLKLEGDLEDGVSGNGEIQGGSIEIIADDAVASWKEQMKTADDAIASWKKKHERR